MAKRVLLVGHDIAPTIAFTRLGTFLEWRGHEVRRIILNTGKVESPSRDTIDTMVAGSDIVLIGLSSPANNAAVEILAATSAVEHGVALGFYADTFGAWQRAWFSPFRQHASFLFVINEKDADAARSIYPNAIALPSGNPLWEEYLESADRSDSRRAVDAGPSDFVILAPGTKNPAVNVKLWADTIDAAYPFVDSAHQPIILLARHPGDKTPADVYATLVEFCSNAGMRIVIPNVKTDDLVPGADVVVHSGTASVAIHAACRRIPIVDMTQGLIMNQWLRREQSRSHTELALASASWEAATALGLGEHLGIVHEALRKEPRGTAAINTLAKAQERMIPNLRKGEALRKMAEAIERM